MYEDILSPPAGVYKYVYFKSASHLVTDARVPPVIVVFLLPPHVLPPSTRKTDPHPSSVPPQPCLGTLSRPWSSLHRRGPCSSAQIERLLRPRSYPVEGAAVGKAASRLDGDRRWEPVRRREQRRAGNPSDGEGGAERQGSDRGRRPRGREGAGAPNCARRGTTCRRGSRERGAVIGTPPSCAKRRLGRRWKEEGDDDRWDPRVSGRGEELL
jgi:hypothetical protein